MEQKAKTPTPFRNTKVSAEKSEADVKKLLKRWGAKLLPGGEDERGDHPLYLLHFELRGIEIAYILPIPTPEDFTSKNQVTPRQRAEAEYRRRWREMYDLINAKLIAVHSSVTTFEKEWATYALDEDGQPMTSRPGWEEYMRERMTAPLALPPGGD